MHNTTILDDNRIMVTVNNHPTLTGSAVFNSPAEAKAFVASL
jgi:hypothetical protein